MQKQEYIHAMEDRLREFDRHMERLVARPRPTDKDAREELEKTYYLIKAKRAELRNRLHEINTLSEGKWDDFVSGMDRLYAEMSQSMDAAQKKA